MFKPIYAVGTVDAVGCPDELWRWLSLGRTKTYELLQSGEILSYKIGRVRRIRLWDVETWLGNKV